MKFLAEFGIVGPFLLDRSPANESGLVIAAIGCNNKVDTPVDAYNITDVRNIAFFDIISDWYMKIIFTVLI